MTELAELKHRLTQQMLDEGVLKLWQEDHDSTNHRGLPWAYTVGRLMHGRPELLVTGLGEAQSLQLLAELEDLDVEPDHDTTTSVGRVSFMLAEPGLLHGAYAVFGAGFKVLQVMVHDLELQPLHPVGGLIITDPYNDGMPETPC